MGGLYPDAPAPRMAWDRDGSKLVLVTTDNAVQEESAASRQAANDEANTVVTYAPSATGTWSWLVLLPEQRDLQGYYLNWVPTGASGVLSRIAWSPNTTTGLDGTWNAISGPVVDSGPVGSGYRTGVRPVNLSGVKAVKAEFGTGAGTGAVGGGSLRCLHLYGRPTVPAATQRLLFWHPTLNQPLSDFPAYFDWGNRPRSSVATRDVRVKNTSDILTASTTVVGVEALTDASPTFVSQHTVSLSGGGFGASVVIPTLAPGQVSPVLTVKQDLLASAALGPWSQRLYAEVGVWT